MPFPKVYLPRAVASRIQCEGCRKPVPFLNQELVSELLDGMIYFKEYALKMNLDLPKDCRAVEKFGELLIVGATDSDILAFKKACEND